MKIDKRSVMLDAKSQEKYQQEILQKNSGAAKKSSFKKNVEGNSKRDETSKVMSRAGSHDKNGNKYDVNVNGASKLEKKTDNQFLNQIKQGKERLKKVPESEKDYSSFDNKKEYAPLDMSADDEEFRFKHSLVPREGNIVFDPPIRRSKANLPKVIK